MSIHNFITQEQLDNLDDDNSIAFMELVNICQRKLSDKLHQLSDNADQNWREMEDLQHSFMNVIVAAAKRFTIEPFASMEIPRINDNLDFRQFQSDLDHYITQLVLTNSMRSKRDSVELPQEAKDRIRSYIHGLRDCIEKSNMDEKRRNKLLDRLDELEKELEKRRANILAVAKLAFDILALPGGVWASYEIAAKLLTNMSQTVEQARIAEQASKPLLPSKPTPALSAPRAVPQPKPQFGGFGDDLDDDVPF